MKFGCLYSLRFGKQLTCTVFFILPNIGIPNGRSIASLQTSLVCGNVVSPASVPNGWKGTVIVTHTYSIIHILGQTLQTNELKLNIRIHKNVDRPLNECQLSVYIIYMLNNFHRMCLLLYTCTYRFAILVKCE